MPSSSKRMLRRRLRISQTVLPVLSASLDAYFSISCGVATPSGMCWPKKKPGTRRTIKWGVIGQLAHSFHRRTKSRRSSSIRRVIVASSMSSATVSLVNRAKKISPRSSNLAIFSLWPLGEGSQSPCVEPRRQAEVRVVAFAFGNKSKDVLPCSLDSSLMTWDHASLVRSAVLFPCHL